MDTLTHALSGALLARATAPTRPAAGELTSGARTAVGFVAAAFPDSDFVLRLFDPLTYVALHRGVTHSIVLLPAWALLLAWLLSLILRQRYSWRAIYGTAALGIAIHIVGDVFTAYGTMLLAPFSSHRFAIPFTFIIDPYFTAIIAIGLATAMLRPPGRRPAIIAFLVLGCYVGFQGILHSQAVKVGEAYAENNGLFEAKIHAFPQPLSPFYWKVIVSHGDDYQVALIDLWQTHSPKPPDPASGILGMWERIAAAYQPVTVAKWIRRRRFGDTDSQRHLAHEAWTQDIFAPFRRFAAFPALNQIELAGNGVCVSFLDLRFTVPSLSPSLVFGLCRDSPTGPWWLEHKREHLQKG
ncbi:MAG: metal-dependent hydrolase [Nitrosospira sp.]